MTRGQTLTGRAANGHQLSKTGIFSVSRIAATTCCTSFFPALSLQWAQLSPHTVSSIAAVYSTVPSSQENSGSYLLISLLLRFCRETNITSVTAFWAICAWMWYPCTSAQLTESHQRLMNITGCMYLVVVLIVFIFFINTIHSCRMCSCNLPHNNFRC